MPRGEDDACDQDTHQDCVSSNILVAATCTKRFKVAIVAGGSVVSANDGGGGSTGLTLGVLELIFVSVILLLGLLGVGLR